MASDQKEKISQRAFEIEIRTGGRMNYRNANALIPQERSQQCDTSISETPIFDRMITAYRELCITRKNGEVANCPGQIYKLHRGIMKFAPATYSNVVPNAQIMFTGLLDFFNTCFDDYGKLSKQSQQLLILNSFELMHRADDLYRSVHHFPDDDTLMPGYTTTFSLDNLDEFLADCPSGVNKEEAMAVIIKNTKRHLLVNKAHFKRLQLSIEEYLAFLGLALWKDHDSNVDDNMAEMVERNRSTIMTELHNHYAHKGKHNYAARLGDLLCLLVNMEELASQHTEDLKVYKLMNMFNEFNV